MLPSIGSLFAGISARAMDRLPSFFTNPFNKTANRSTFGDAGFMVSKLA